MMSSKRLAQLTHGELDTDPSWAREIRHTLAQLPGVDFTLQVWKYPEKLRHLHLAYLEASQRGRGLGSSFMEVLTDLADREGVTLSLDADVSYGATSKARLEHFYRRFGFVLNKGRHADYSLSARMYRRPLLEKR